MTWGDPAEELIAQSFQNAEIRRVLNKLPSEFEEVLIARIKCEMGMLLSFCKYIRGLDQPDNEKIIELLETLLMKEFENLKTEPDRFKEKYGSDMIETINEANYCGSDTKKLKLIDDAIFRLVKLDKAWLTVAVIGKIIIDRQYYDDKTFRKRLGKIVSQKPDSLKSISSNQSILQLVKLFGLIMDLKNSKVRKVLHANLEDRRCFEDLEDVTPLSDFDYFSKQLKRHNII